MGEQVPNDETLSVLLKIHRKFLAFLERRVNSPQIAEEVLQPAYTKAVEQQDALEEETIVAWFYLVLRNALTDYYRRRDVHNKHISQSSEVLHELADPASGMKQDVCECIRALISTLKPEYAEIVERVDLACSTLSEATQLLGITANNAGVRLSRARNALRKSLEAAYRTCAVHGCFNCTCKK
jgi:RNA polymerase sigma-70 factor, ECF subfamily